MQALPQGTARETTEYFHLRGDTGRYATACKQCVAARNREYARSRAAKNRDHERDKTRWYNQNLRALIIREYGGACACCGEPEPMFLGLDHVKNDGAHERRLIGSNNISTYRLARDLGFPRDRYQLLCHNCNLAKGFYGTCPHLGGTVREAAWPGRRPVEDHSKGRVCRVCAAFKSRRDFYEYKNGRLMSRCKPCCIRINAESEPRGYQRKPFSE